MVAQICTYILVSQDERRIELYSRQADGSWRYDVVKGPNTTIRLETIDCDLRLDDVYARVAFPPAATVEITE